MESRMEENLLKNKKFRLELIAEELSTIRGSRILLMRLLGKRKKRLEDYERTISETLELNRIREQELLDEREGVLGERDV